MDKKIDEVWSLTEEQRLDALTRAFSSLCSLGFAPSETGEDKDGGWKTANALEEQAYAAAGAQAVTTTGPRPKGEVTKAYARWGKWADDIARGRPSSESIQGRGYGSDSRSIVMYIYKDLKAVSSLQLLWK